LLKRSKVYSILLLTFSLITIIVIDQKIKAPSASARSEETPIYTIAQTDSIVKTIFKKFAIPDSLCLAKKNKTVNKIPYYKNYSVTIPADLPIPVVLADIYRSFSFSNINITSIETRMNWANYIILDANDGNKIYYDLRRSETLHRSATEIVIVINDITALDEKTRSIWLEEDNLACYIFSPSRENIRIARLLDDNDREYMLKLDEKTEDPEFKLKSGFKPARLQQSLDAIIRSFSQCEKFIVTESAWHSGFATQIGADLKANAKEVIPDENHLLAPQFTTAQDAESFLDRICSDKAKSGIILETNHENYQMMRNGLETIQNRGVRIISLSQCSAATATNGLH
jgi:hypothetical protein